MLYRLRYTQARGNHVSRESKYGLETTMGL